MEEQVAVEDLVQAALGVEEAHVPLELLTVEEGEGQLVDQDLLLGGEGIGIGGIHGGEVGVQHGIDLAVHRDGLVLVVHLVQQQAVGHAEGGVAEDLLPLQLEEDHGDGLVHPGGEQLVLFRVLLRLLPGELDGEAAHIAVPVDLVGKDRQGAQGDAVAGLDDLQVVVAQGVGQHRGHQGAGAGGRPHPQHVVVAPLDVHAVVVQQGVQDDVRPGAPVEDVPHHVEVIHRQALDELAQLHQKVGGPADVNDGGDDVLVVVPLVVVLVVGVEHLVQDVGILLRHGLAHLGTGVLGAGQPAQLNQPVEGDAVPLPHVGGVPPDLLQLLAGVVDQRGQLIPLRLGHGGGKEVVQLLPHHAGGGVEDVKEGLVLTVKVGDKVLRALGQVQNGLEVDNLAAGRLYRGVLLGQELQIAQFFLRKRLFPLHSIASF